MRRSRSENAIHIPVAADCAGLFALRCDTGDYKDAAKLAAQIAELPEREVTENDA